MTPRRKIARRKILVIPEASKICLSPEAAQHVYEAVLQNLPVDPLSINQPMSMQCEEISNQNPYTAVMNGDLDVYGNADPFWKLKQSELCWSLMSTEIGYKVDTTKGPYSSLILVECTRGLKD